MQRRYWIGIVAIALFAAAAGSFWWFWQRPIKVISDAFASLADADTQQFSAAVLLENATATTQLLGEQGQVELNIDGSFARQDDKRDSLTMTVALTSKTESVSVQIEGEMRFIDEHAYILIKKAPQAVPLLAQLKGTWIRLPRGGQQTAPKVETNDQLFANIARQRRERIADATTNKYQATATTTAVLRLLDGIADLLGTRLTEEQIVGIRQSLAEVKEVPVELWITPLTHELKQLHTTFTVSGGNTVSFTLALNDRNEPIDMAVPEGAVTLEEMLRAAIPQPTPQPTPQSTPQPTSQPQ